MQTTEQTKTVAYIRVSTSKQAEHGFSLEAQQAKIQAYATLYNLDVIETIIDAATAKHMEREGLQRALKLIRDDRAQALLVVKLDRLTRSVRDLDTLIQDYFIGGCALLSVSEQIDTRSAAGRLVLNVLASVSQWEREATSERTSAVLQHKSAGGGYIGGIPPFGYRAESGQLVEDRSEQTTVALARQLRPSRSLRAVSAELTRQGHSARNEKAFSAVQIRRMLGESNRVFGAAA